ncbi:MAG TPA: OmpH family outer membrane protein [Bryobacteraceae bacterium]|nr:OmpH family outer membrane protein [Bryobacteraceae bacterium]
MNTKVLLSAAVALGLAAGARAQSQPPKIAVIYLQGAIGNTKDGQKAVAELEAKTAPKKKQIDQRQSEIASLQDQLTKGANTMSDAAKNDLYKNIETKKKNLQRDLEDAQAELDQDQQKILQQIGTKMQAVIERYAHDHGYVMVVDVSSPQSPVFYASPSIDITKDIIELYDQSSAQLSNPAPAPKTGAAPSAPPAAKPAPSTPPPAKPATPKQ